MNKKNKLKVGIYLRLSNEDKKDFKRDSESIKNQRNLLHDYIKKQKNFLLVQEYCDENLSGAGTYRPEFERLINDCKEKKLDIVLCKSQSRFSRDMEIIEKYIHNKFIEWNIRFIGISDNADTNIIGNKKARQINGLVNEWYLEDVSNNIRSALHTKMKQGELISPFAPYGYEISKTNNNQLIVDPIASTIVKKIFSLYLKGYGFTKIANNLNKEQIPSPSKYKHQKGIKLNIISNQPITQIPWNTNAIKNILTNEVYLGNLIQGKRTTTSYKNKKIILKDKNNWIKVENTHEAIIDSKTFYEVQKTKQKRHRPQKKTGTIHPFSKKVYCLECGKYFRKKDTKYHTYLVCANPTCKNKSSIRYDKLEQLILKKINNRITTYYDPTLFTKALNTITNKNTEEQINLLKIEKKEILKQIKKNEYYLQNTYQDKIEHIITLKQFKKLNKIYQENDKNDKRKLILTEKKLSTLIKTNNLKTNNIITTPKKLTTLNQTILKEFIETIKIGILDKEQDKREIIIIWNNH